MSEKQEVERLLVEYKEHQTDTLYQSVMDIIVNANEERFQVDDMCEALERIVEYHKQRVWEQGIEQGRIETLLSLVRDGLLSPEEAAKRAGMTVDEIQKS